LMNTVQNLRSEMESGCGSGHRAAFAGIDGLITVAVGGGIRTGDVGGKRDVTDFVHPGEEIFRGCEADVAFAECAAGDHFGLKFGVVAEEEMFANPDLASGTD